MRIVLCLLLLVSTTVYAQQYLVFNYNQNVRIVLSNQSCLIAGLAGLRASVQRTDGQFIRGCWQFVNNNKQVRIDWENPSKPGDYAILNADNFNSVDQ